MARDYIPPLVERLTHKASKKACNELTQLLEKEGFSIDRHFKHNYAEKENSKRVCQNTFVHLRAQRDNDVVVARFDSATVTDQIKTANAWGHLPRAVIYLRTAYGALGMGMNLEQEKKRKTTGLLFTYDLPSHELDALTGLILNAELFNNDCAVKYVKGELTISQKPFYQDASFAARFRTTAAQALTKPILSIPTQTDSMRALSSRPTDRKEAY